MTDYSHGPPATASLGSTPPWLGSLDPQGYWQPAGTHDWYDPTPLRQDEEQLWSMVGHLSYFAFAIIIPVVIMITVGRRSIYVRHHAVEALNFHITAALATLAGLVLAFFLVGVFLLPIVIVGSVVLAIVATVRSYQGELYRYPFTLRVVN